MKMYIRLAFSNIIKNRRLYVPHICTGAGLTAVFYIMITLAHDNRLQSVKGGNYLPTVMSMGVIVLGLVSVILMLYTNSFLMKQRQSEFGLYNVLGMEKRHIGRILLCETLFAAVTALTAGLLFGIALYKLCALIICKMLKVESVLGLFKVSLRDLGPVVLVFVCIYSAIFIFNRIRIAAMKPMKLLASAHEGEREPRTKWLIAILGVATLGAGYYISLTTKSPLKALWLFFLAVILVIIGTYFLFIAGSIVVLKILRRNKKIYYKSRNMIGISGMLYRMKQNAAGLASIAILATCVLVMMSSTVTLYAGIEDSLEKEFPHHVNVSATYYTVDPEIKKEYEEELEKNDGYTSNEAYMRYYEAQKSVAVPDDVVIEILKKAAKDNGFELAHVASRSYLMVAYHFDGQSFVTRDNIDIYDGIAECFFTTAESYNDVNEANIELAKDEILVAELSGNSQKIGETINLAGKTFRVKGKTKDFIVSMNGYSLADCYGIVVADEEVLNIIYQAQLEDYKQYASEISSTVMADFTNEELAEQAFLQKRSAGIYGSFGTYLQEYIEKQENADGAYGTSWRSVWEMRSEMYGMFGTLMFLGILLSIVFMMATALIIYYKQVSEGYDDRGRFHIMQKVGMGSDEVKKTIRSQVLTVFFMPVLVAALHMAMAFPIIVRLMRVLFVPSITLFVICTLAAFAIFCGVYVVIYILTAKMYYHIVRLEG